MPGEAHGPGGAAAPEGPVDARPVTPAGVLAAELDALVARAEGGEPTGELLGDLRRARDLAAGFEPYVEASTSPASPALRALDARTRAEDWATHRGDTGLEQEMLSGHVEGQLLRMLVHATGARRVLEIGLFTGYSALAMAEALPAGGELVALEVDAHAAAIAREALDAAGLAARTRIAVAPAADTLAALAADGERFDLVFVDADKGGYADYLDAVLAGGLLAPGGLIVVDNTLMQGLPWRGGPSTANGDAIAAFNRRVADDPRVEQVLVPLRDGVTLIRRHDPARGAA